LEPNPVNLGALGNASANREGFMNRRHLLRRVASAIAVSTSCGVWSQTAPFVYRGIKNQDVKVTAYLARRVALLVPEGEWHKPTLQLLVATLDRAWDAYALLTGREPVEQAKYAYKGRATIAVVEATCGAACGLLGHTGIEMEENGFRSQVHDRLRDTGRYDQALFYEMGRNFWSFGEQVNGLASMTTGFAIANRFLSMRLANAPGADFNRWKFVDFERAVGSELTRHWLSQPNRSWERALGRGDWPDGLMGPDGTKLDANDLAAGLLMEIQSTSGYSGYRKFWTALSSSPVTKTPQAARDNFLRAARDAAGMDLSRMFDR